MKLNTIEMAYLRHFQRSYDLAVFCVRERQYVKKPHNYVVFAFKCRLPDAYDVLPGTTQHHFNTKKNPQAFAWGFCLSLVYQTVEFIHDFLGVSVAAEVPIWAVDVLFEIVIPSL